jgi:hypothetical protein
VGWFLVVTTSGMAAFFTMLYGLHYGRASSLRWLISMAVSLVESVFITQPLKVRTPAPKRFPSSLLPTPGLLGVVLSLGSSHSFIHSTYVHSVPLLCRPWAGRIPGMITIKTQVIGHSRLSVVLGGSNFIIAIILRIARNFICKKT